MTTDTNCFRCGTSLARFSRFECDDYVFCSSLCAEEHRLDQKTSEVEQAATEAATKIQIAKFKKKKKRNDDELGLFSPIESDNRQPCGTVKKSAGLITRDQQDFFFLVYADEASDESAPDEECLGQPIRGREEIPRGIFFDLIKRGEFEPILGPATS